MTISESKKALRKEILAKRRNLSEAYQKQAAQEIYEKLRALAVYKEASVLCLYVPIQKEVDLFQYIPEFRADGKQIYLPRVEGAYHILEPDSTVQLEPEKTGGTCLIVMPGAVFTRSCDRIGYGGGYYDRYLAAHPDCHTAAVGYAIQIVDSIMTEETDIKPEVVLYNSKQ